jgi:hypothetical protein
MGGVFPAHRVIDCARKEQTGRLGKHAASVDSARFDDGRQGVGRVIRVYI